MPYLHKEDSGHLIWDALAGGTPLTKRQILLLTDLTRSEFRKGMEWIKDVFQGEQVQPIAYDHTSHEYRLAEQWRHVGDYAGWTLRGLVTRTRRISSTLAAAAERFPDSPAAGRVQRDAQRLVDDVEDMLREVSNHHAEAG